MKRSGDLFERIIAFENLLNAAKEARAANGIKRTCRASMTALNRVSFALQDELRSKSYLPGDYRTFEIYEAETPDDFAAPYRDRVVHHALCNVIGPIFERTFIADSYANRGSGRTRCCAVVLSDFSGQVVTSCSATSANIFSQH